WVRRVPRPGPGLACLGRWGPARVAGIPGPAPGTRAGTGLSGPTRSSTLPDRRCRARRPAPGQALPRSWDQVLHGHQLPAGRSHSLMLRTAHPSGALSMKLVIYPAVEPDRYQALQAAAPRAEWVNAATTAEAEAALPGADAFIGKITPALLARADRLQWV